MQTLDWYYRRLQAMSLSEVLWRCRCAVRDTADRHLHGFRTRSALRRVSAVSGILEAPGFSVSRMPDSAVLKAEFGEAAAEWIERLISRADRIAADRLDIFDLKDHDFGERIDWNRDPKSGKAAPMKYAPLVDYRDFDSAGDCKFVWEPNRHHQLVVLGRAYQATGETKYAEAAVRQWSQWLDQCPHAIGMNWRSGLELGIRLINWVWAIDLLLPSGKLDADFRRRLLQAVYLHVWDISRNYSRGSSAGNHRIGEAAGVFIASCYFHELKYCTRWATESREILRAEILKQTFSDGGTREQALGYQQFVMQFFLLSGLVARWSKRDFPVEYWKRLRRMFFFVSAVGEGGDRLPVFGDCDDGYVLDLDGDPHDPRPWLGIGAAVFNDAELAASGGGVSEAGVGLLGTSMKARLESLTKPSGPRELVSRAFPETGYYLLQCGHVGEPDRISVGFDCGELGYRSIAAHGHADALSITLRAFGKDILVDPGTYDYFTYPRWREYFRSTRAHNTVTVDGQDQSEMLGPFLWGSRAKSSCLVWEPGKLDGRVCGMHDGYRRLTSPVIHRRSIELDGNDRVLVIEDEFDSAGRHEYAQYFHFAEDCEVTRNDGRQYEVEAGPGRISVEFDEQLTIKEVRGSDAPIGGWVSRGYHHKVAGVTIVGCCTKVGVTKLYTRIKIGQAALEGGDCLIGEGRVHEIGRV